MTRHGNPIRQYGLKDSIQTGISYTLAFEEVNAVVRTGLSLEKYWDGEYPVELLALAVAYVRNENLVKLHSEDAVARKMASKAKK